MHLKIECADEIRCIQGGMAVKIFLGTGGLGSEVEKYSFITLPGEGGHTGFLPQKTMCSERVALTYIHYQM